jgi:phytanoyl-CoA hydroxylase
VIPGSHHEPARPLRPNTETPSLFGAEIDTSAVDVSSAVPVELASGDLSAHHPNLIHGSDANESDGPRRALAIRYRASSSSRRS